MDGLTAVRNAPIYDPPELVANLFASCAHIRPSADRMGLLAAIALGFARLPYENATKIIKQERVADPLARMRGPVELLEDYRDYGTGGTCFSLVHCLRTILSGFQFECYVAMADMQHGPDIHCTVVVCLDHQRILMDPGYLIPYPVRLPLPGQAQRSRNYMNEVEYRRSDCGRFVDLFTLDSKGAKWRYRMKDAPVTEEDFIKNWQRSFELTMMKSLVITRADDHGQLYLHNDHLRLIRETGKQNRRLTDGLESQVELLFGVSSRIVERARNILRR